MKRAGWTIAAAGGASAAAAVLGAMAVFRVLERIDNSPEAYAEHGGVIWRLGLVSMAVAMGACALCWSIDVRSLRRASRFTVWTLAANFVLWMAPVPFGVHRVLTIGLVMIGAGLMLMASLAPVWAALRRRLIAWEWWRSPLAALGAFAAASSAMLMFKAGQLGWAFAVD